MIAKIKTGKFFKGALFYNIKKVMAGDARQIYASGFLDPFPENILNTFLERAEICPIAKPVAHISLNFAPEEKLLSRETLISLAKEYLERMGYIKTPFVVFEHRDTAHQHIHIVATNIYENQTGQYRAIRTSNNFYTSKAVCADLEKKYGLVISEGHRMTPEEIKILNYGKTPTFDYLKMVVHYILGNKYFVSLAELNRMLLRFNVKAFHNTTSSGEDYYKFCFFNKEKMQEVGIGGTPKKLRLDYSNNDIKNLFIRNKEITNKEIQGVRRLIKELLKEYFSLSRRDINCKLEPYNFQLDQTGQLLYLKNDHFYDPQYIGITENFIQRATVHRNQFKVLTKTVTAFMREQNIFYQSTLLQQQKLLKIFKAYLQREITTLSTMQINILYDGYVKYKSKQIDRIIEKERKRDIQWVSKLFVYINSLTIPYVDKIALLSKLGVEFKGKNIQLHNRTEIHEIDPVNIPTLGFDSLNSKYFNLINSLAPAEIQVIRSLVSGFVYQPEIDYNRLLPLLPDHFPNRLTKLKQFYQKKRIKSNLYTLLPNQYDMHSGKLLHWDEEEDNEDEEDIDITRKRGKKL